MTVILNYSVNHLSLLGISKELSTDIFRSTEYALWWILWYICTTV